MSGELHEGDSLGHESDLVERFGVSRPSLREALRILEAEGLITVVRGVLGGVVVHEPDERMTARTAAVVLQSRNVSLADVYDARSLLELTAVRVVASTRARRGPAAQLRQLIDEQERRIEDPEAFGRANARFHERLVEAGRQPDADGHRRDAQRDRGQSGHRDRPGRTRAGLGAHPATGHPLAGATRRADRGRRRRRPPSSTGASTWRWSVGCCSASGPAGVVDLTNHY